jgi:hypothetical protein
VKEKPTKKPRRKKMSNIDTRKVQFVGSRNSMTITLPKVWTNFYGIENHDTIPILWDDLLIVCPSNDSKYIEKAKRLLGGLKDV